LLLEIALDSKVLYLVCGHLTDAAKWYAVGCKLMLQSGYHKDLHFDFDGLQSQKISETEREVRRRLFWVFYVLGLYGSFVLVSFRF
jgi:hypothetical protein